MTRSSHSETASGRIGSVPTAYGTAISSSAASGAAHRRRSRAPIANASTALSASTAGTPAASRTTVPAPTGATGTPPARMTAGPATTRTPTATAPTANTAVPSAAARTANSRPGTRAEAPNRAASTTAAASANGSPSRSPPTPPNGSSVAGPMSPMPLTVHTPSASTPPEARCSRSQSVRFMSPTGSLAHAPAPAPSTPMWSNTPTACVNRTSGVPAPSAVSRTVRSPGEVASIPTCTVSGRPATTAVPTSSHACPSADSNPVIVSPDLVSRSHTGVPGAVALPATSPVYPYCIRTPCSPVSTSAA
ncbi:hypothetical protein GCM10009830_42100 [Glycomyces endophyticus]|uniref:Uncharacterized protein n=1 Tax=Glycomyces endophyticus TaxID=480996 RepID=A0ABN2HM01_9ACTN